MDRFDLVIHAPRAITPDGEVARTIAVREGRIAAVEPQGVQLSGTKHMDLSDDVVLLPGLVDSHVHICEPGNTEWEGFACATRAAAAGGITTLVDMPLDSIPTTVTVPALEAKRDAACDQCFTDVGFWAGVVPVNGKERKPLVDAGVCGFKCFLVDSGSPDFPPVSTLEMEDALVVARDCGVPLLVHAESEEVVSRIETVHSRRYRDYLATRPRGSENLAVAQVIEAARRTGGHAHIVHLSSADVLRMIASAQREGVHVTAEVCPHYLTFSAEEIPDGATPFKCSPPIRETVNRDRLWKGLEQGVLDLVVSDHSPCTAAMKEMESGDFGSAWAGVTSLQLSLPAVWTQASRRGLSLTQVAVLMGERPARLAGLPRKGRISVGCDADFCVFAPDETFEVDPAHLHHRHPVTPYAGRTLRGVVRTTLLRGDVIDSENPRGRLLTREHSVQEPTLEGHSG